MARKNRAKLPAIASHASVLSKGAQVKDEEWNFGVCPHPEQTEACYLFEFSREAEPVVADVLATRKQMKWRESHDEEFTRYLMENPFPTLPIERDAWCRRTLEIYPSAIPSTRLTSSLHFLIACPWFPEKSWLEIPANDRERMAKPFCDERYRWTGSPHNFARHRMSILTLKKFEEFRRASMFPNAKPWAGESDDHVFSFFWARSDRKLIEDFRRWLIENRPADQPAVEHTVESKSRQTTPREFLKALSALRLIQAFQNDFTSASFHAYERLDKLLYRDQAAWLKAAKKAKVEIANFGERGVQKTPSVG